VEKLPFKPLPLIRPFCITILYHNLLLPPFQNIRCFRFVKQIYLDMF
jgi:hypothetical protein